MSSERFKTRSAHFPKWPDESTGMQRATLGKSGSEEAPYGSIKCIPEGPPPGQLRSGMIFCAKFPTLGDKLLSNFSRGRGGAMGRGSFHAKVLVLVLFIKNGRLPLQLIKKKIRWKCRRTFCESFVVVFVTYRRKWLTENSR